MDVSRECFTRSGHCVDELDQLNIVHIAGSKGKVQVNNSFVAKGLF